MKKVTVFFALASLALVLSYCGSSKKATKTAAAMNYDSNVKAIIEQHCSPCHIPAKGGRKTALDSYAAVSKHFDEILRRVQLNPTDRGFMPDDNPKLSDDQINILKQWKSAGLAEK